MKSFLTRRSLLISLLSPTHSHPPHILGTKNHLIFVFSPCGAAALTTGRGQSLIRSVEARGGGGGGGGGGRDTAAPHAALDRRLLFVRGLCQAAVHRGDQTKSEGVLCRLDLLNNICVARPLHVPIPDGHQVIALSHSTNLGIDKYVLHCTKSVYTGRRRSCAQARPRSVDLGAGARVCVPENCICTGWPGLCVWALRFVRRIGGT